MKKNDAVAIRIITEHAGYSIQEHNDHKNLDDCTVRSQTLIISVQRVAQRLAPGDLLAPSSKGNTRVSVVADRTEPNV